MIKPSLFYNVLKENNIDFFTGVPDSQLKEFCDYLTSIKGISSEHIIAPNEGNAVALACGHYLATSSVGMVYMQNSGLGNAVNPITSLADEQVYGIPVLYMIGFRGMPGVKDEPQHVKQGQITLELLNLLGIEYFVLDKNISISDIKSLFSNKINDVLSSSKSFAFVVEKSFFEDEKQYINDNKYEMVREDVIGKIISSADSNSVFVSTTGKISRELFDQRKKFNQMGEKDFLTVGSMGHASMIAMKIALCYPQKKVYCIDGDGAFLMHMGTSALIGANAPKNLVHIILNNQSHESVGGLPTVVKTTDIVNVALACGYEKAKKVVSYQELDDVLKDIKINNTTMIEVMVNTFSREDLSRPDKSPIENKEMFMNYLRGENN